MSATSSDTDPVDMVIDILTGVGASEWTHATPEIQRHSAVPYSEKGPGDGQVAQLYVWNPVDTTIEQLSADGTYLDSDATVEVQIWSLDPEDVTDYREDVVDIFGDYLDTQQDTTEFVAVPPTGARDYRADKNARMTDHFINRVEISPRRLRFS